MAAPNPYASPSASTSVVVPPTFDYFESDGCLVVREGTILPDVCILTGEPTGGGDRITRTIAFYPRWLIIVFIVNRLVALVLALALRKSFRVTYGLSPAARARRQRGLFIGLGVLVASIALIYFGSFADDPSAPVLLGLLGGVVGTVLAVILGRPFRARNAANGYLYLELRGAALDALLESKARHAPVAQVIAAHGDSPFG